MAASEAEKYASSDKVSTGTDSKLILSAYADSLESSIKLTKKEQFLSYTSQFDTTLRKKGYNVRLGTRR